MNQGIEVKPIYEIKYMVLSGDCRERRVVEREVKPDHQGLEYQAKCFKLYSVGSRKLLKDYELRNEMFRTFLFVFNLAGVGWIGRRKV